MRGLVLSIFPGIDLLGRSFEALDWCVVRGPDVILGGDVRGWHVPPGRFDGVIGGPPCQSFSRLANIVRATGHEPKFGNLIPEFERVVSEARPRWFLMEEVPEAPTPTVQGYELEVFCLSPRWLGDPQSRKRRFSFGARDGLGRRGIEARLPVVALENVEFVHAQHGGGRAIPIKIGGSGKVKVGARIIEAEEVKRRHGVGLGRFSRSASSAAKIAIGQGFPGLDEHLPAFTVEAKCQALGNGVPRVMGEALARAIAGWERERESASEAQHAATSRRKDS